MKLYAWGLSDVGIKRDQNEDSFLVQPDHGLFAVADGMGGHQGGAQASRLAVEIVEREIKRADLGDTAVTGPGDETPPAQHLKSAARLAGRTIFELAESNASLMGMGTTLTSLLFHHGRVYLAHVGDSRAYLFRDDRLEQLTTDHSWIEEQVRAGLLSMDEAQQSSLKHVITRSVGFEHEVEVDLLVQPVALGDCFLLCSDGLSNNIPPEELRVMFCREFFCDIPRLLIDAANKRGGDDNVTAVVVYAANELEHTEQQRAGDEADAAGG